MSKGSTEDASTALLAVCESVKRTVSDKITPANVIVVVTAAMQAAELVRGLAGPQKKELALEAVGVIVRDIDVNEEDRAAINAVIGALGGPIIDSLVAAAKGQFDFGEIKKKSKACLGLCLGGPE